ncbi:MAG: ABC transporter permease [Vicinamibacterales bacterium]
MIEYDSAVRRPPPIEEFIELIRFRDLTVQVIKRDVVARYKRSVLGVAWTLLNPLAMMVILTLIFSELFAAPAFPVYVLSGLLVWTFFAQTTTAAMTQLIQNRGLLHHIYVPRTIFAVAAIGTGLVNLVISLVPLALIMFFVHSVFGPALMLLPVAILMLALFALGVGMLLSTLAVYFPDVQETYQIVLTAWMYLTPIFYPEDILPESYRWWLLNLNPLYHLMRLFRVPIYDGHWPALWEVGVASGVACLAALVGWIVLAQRADEIVYRV